MRPGKPGGRGTAGPAHAFHGEGLSRPVSQPHLAKLHLLPLGLAPAEASSEDGERRFWTFLGKERHLSEKGSFRTRLFSWRRRLQPLSLSSYYVSSAY